MESQISNGKKQANEETTHIDFYQAMRDFKIMFPLMDDDVIEEVLRANRGAVDATIDQLLAMSTDNLNETLRHNLERDETSSADGIRCSEPPDVTKNGITSRARRKWSPPLLGPLPPTFLRIAPVEQKPHSDCHEDERIAFFLQNEEFLSELRANQDFLSTLDTDVEEKGTIVSDAELFKERLRNMGKVQVPPKTIGREARAFPVALASHQAGDEPTYDNRTAALHGKYFSVPKLRQEIQRCWAENRCFPADRMNLCARDECYFAGTTIDRHINLECGAFSFIPEQE